MQESSIVMNEVTDYRVNNSNNATQWDRTDLRDWHGSKQLALAPLSGAVPTIIKSFSRQHHIADTI